MQIYMCLYVNLHMPLSKFTLPYANLRVPSCKFAYAFK